MPRCEFGTPEKVSANASTALAKVTPKLKQIFTATGLHDVSALNPTDGFILAVVNHCNVTDEEEFLYIDAEWPEQAAASDVNHPPNASVMAFITELGNEITFVNSANQAQLQDDMKQLSPRIMRAYKEVYRIKDKTSAGAPEGEDMEVKTDETMASLYLAIYGENVVVSSLALSSVCNSLHKQLTTGMVVDDLKCMIRRSNQRRSKSKLEFDFETGKSKSSHSYSKSIDSVDEFLERLETYLNSLVYVSSMHVAPTDQWDGKPKVGVVRGVRYQFSQAGAKYYLGFWREHASKFKGHVQAIIDLEASTRALWIDKFGTERMSLESAVRESVAEKGAKVDAWSPPFGKRTREWEPWSSGGKGDGGKGDKGKGKGDGGKGKGDWGGGKGKIDVSQQPGFRIGCKPFAALYQGKHFCPYYNRGQDCWSGAGCGRWHKCDCTKADGTPCAEDHSRQEHVL